MRKGLLALPLLVALVFLAVSCGGDDDGGSAAGDATTTAAEASCDKGSLDLATPGS